MTDTAAIQFATDAVIATNGGKTFVSAVHSDAVRAALIKLLEAYDVHGLENKVQADELAMLYASTRNSHTQGKGVADRLAKKHSPNPLLDPATPAPKATPPVPQFDPPKAPDAAPMAAFDDSGIWRAIGDMRTDVRVLDANLTNAIDRLADIEDNTVARVNAGLAARIDAAIKSQTPTRLEITAPDMPPVQLGLTHFRTPLIIKMLAAGVNVYLYGEAGTGKTTAGQQCADAFKLPFYFAAKVESEYMLLGFKDARGETVRTQFREAYENGGVFLFDELDGSSAGAIVALNAALANGICPFPDGVVQRHKDFKCIAAGNTKLTGASRQYVGRNQLDAASVDRFAFVEFPADEQLEATIAADAQWCRYVQAVRKAVRERQLPHLVTPRATYDGCKLLAAGLDVDTVADACVWKGLDRATVTQLQGVVGDVSDYFNISLVA